MNSSTCDVFIIKQLFSSTFSIRLAEKFIRIFSVTSHKSRRHLLNGQPNILLVYSNIHALSPGCQGHLEKSFVCYLYSLEIRETLTQRLVSGLRVSVHNLSLGSPFYWILFCWAEKLLFLFISSLNWHPGGSL